MLYPYEQHHGYFAMNAKCYTPTNNIMVILLNVTVKCELIYKKYFLKIWYCYSRLYQEFGVHIQA